MSNAGTVSFKYLRYMAVFLAFNFYDFHFLPAFLPENVLRCSETTRRHVDGGLSFNECRLTASFLQLRAGALLPGRHAARFTAKPLIMRVLDVLHAALLAIGLAPDSAV